MNVLNRIEITDSVVFNSIKDSRFKTMRISAVAFMPLKAETASVNALLTKVLMISCEKYPDFTELSRKLSSLYGASLNATFSKVGDSQALCFTVAGIDDRYALDGDVVSKELSSLLCEIIFSPKLVNGVFDSSELEQGRRELIDIIDSEYNEKRIYAASRATSIMCENEAFGISRYGTKEGVNAVTPKSLFDAWQNMIKTAKFEIVYTGESDSLDVCDTFKKHFSAFGRKPSKLENVIVRCADNVKREKEEMELSQSKLIMGFRTDCAEPDSGVMATRLMSAVLGGTAHSKLFSNVREKLSLCYYCMSRYNRNKGILFVESGVESDNVEKAQSAILNEIKSIQNGDITDFELESAKLSVTNSFIESCDTASGIEYWYVSQMLDGKIYSADEACAAINNVTKQEVIDAAKRLTLDTVYTLIGTQKD